MSPLEWIILLLLLLALCLALRRLIRPKPKKECVIKAIDWPAVDNDNQDFARKHPEALRVGSKEDLANKVLAKLREEDCCIKKLILLGHGAPGVISTGAGVETVTCREINGDSEEWQTALGGLRGKFCDDAEIIMFGCSVGQCDDGATKLAEVADFFGVTVRAPSRDVYAREDPEENSDQKAEPGKKPEPKNCDKSPEEDVRHKEEPTGVSLPSAGDVDAMAIYAGTRAYWETRPETEFSIRNPERIASLLGAVDYSTEYEGNGLKAKYDARGFVRTRAGEITVFHVFLRWYAVELRQGDDRSVYMLKPGTREMVRESATTV